MYTLTINQTNKINNTNTNTDTKQTSITNLNNKTMYVKTPKWLKSLKCSINPANNKKSNNINKSFELAIALSETDGVNRNRISNTEKSLEKFNFDNINHPPKEEDYKTFQRNNQSIKLIVFILDNENKKLRFHYNQKDVNKRNKKVAIILLGNNYYIHVTKLNLLNKYIQCDD